MEHIESIRKLFLYYKSLGEKTMAQLDEEALFFSPGENSNSISIIVNHLSGNMLSRWTDFLSADGEKSWRNRDGEFIEKYSGRADMLEAWEHGWQVLFQAIDSINMESIDTIVYIRNEGHSIIEALHRQLAHYAYHVGQIVFIGRMIKGDEWTSLSIPRNQSAEYNEKRFSQAQDRRHFTDNV